MPGHYEFWLHVNEIAQQITVLLRVSVNLWSAFLFPPIRGLCDIIITKLQRQGGAGGEAGAMVMSITFHIRAAQHFIVL